MRPSIERKNKKYCYENKTELHTATNVIQFFLDAFPKGGILHIFYLNQNFSIKKIRRGIKNERHYKSNFKR